MPSRLRLGTGTDTDSGTDSGTDTDSGSDTGTDTGAGSVAAIGVVGALLLAVGLVIPVGAVLAERQRAAGAADAAALAAADVAIGLRPGSPCAVAATVASANGATVSGCSVDGVIVTVRVSISRGITPLTATATAGPPP